jgi:hypothetical protein
MFSMVVSSLDVSTQGRLSPDADDGQLSINVLYACAFNGDMKVDDEGDPNNDKPACLKSWCK